jgi:hypothetical protein
LSSKVKFYGNIESIKRHCKYKEEQEILVLSYKVVGNIILRERKVKAVDNRVNARHSLALYKNQTANSGFLRRIATWH